MSGCIIATGLEAIPPCEKCLEFPVTIGCPSNKTIFVHKAVYGYTKETKCHFLTDEPEGKRCGRAFNTTLVFKRCHGKNQCNFPVNKQTFRDPCPGWKHKTFWMDWSCCCDPKPPEEPFDWFNYLFWPILILFMICCLVGIYFFACRKDKEESESSSSSRPPRGSVKHKHSRKQEDSTISVVKDTMTDAMSKSVASLRGSIKSKNKSGTSSMRTPSLGRQSTSRK